MMVGRRKITPLRQLRQRAGAVGVHAVATLLCACTTASPPAPLTPTVLPEIDVLLRPGPGPLAGTRVGLITNRTGIITLADASGDTVSTMDVLHRHPVVALFSPEHSSTARSEAGASRTAADVAIDTASVGGPTTTQIADIGDLAEVYQRFDRMRS